MTKRATPEELRAVPADQVYEEARRRTGWGATPLRRVPRFCNGPHESRLRPEYIKAQFARYKREKKQ